MTTASGISHQFWEWALQISGGRCPSANATSPIGCHQGMGYREIQAGVLKWDHIVPKILTLLHLPGWSCVDNCINKRGHLLKAMQNGSSNL